ncbi:glycosyltransferase family 2 protein [Conexibacter sp. CPCC 206217]|uniref:glycosyltransferase family 2 protein n=1 Tax=Conexibacter sp. CPCC 206217 TaxID=3064574 RepID=UPI0027281469|nr:glycosyltransferase [Conexibacter sp. CPCC 206217]MDO8210027.1 glycosyltransferase [Conexibacter sp. CPCC 206217]
MSSPPATIVIPTRNRPGYLDVTLASLQPQAAARGAELLVVLDGPDPVSAATAARHGARVIALDRQHGPNAARNAAIDAAGSDLLAFVDDDVRVPPSWLEALLAAAAATPDRDAFTGPIHAVLEGGGPRACGREAPPITAFDAGPADVDVPLAWSANLAIRRSAFESAGRFDEAIPVGGDEEEWLERHRAAGGRIRYVAAAGLDHRRTPADATLRSLSRAAFHRGRAGRRTDVRKGVAPSLMRELRVFAGCCWHVPRRLCLIGVVMAAHSAGRIREALARR